MCHWAFAAHGIGLVAVVGKGCAGGFVAGVGHCLGDANVVHVEAGGEEHGRIHWHLGSERRRVV